MFEVQKRLMGRIEKKVRSWRGKLAFFLGLISQKTISNDIHHKCMYTMQSLMLLHSILHQQKDSTNIHSTLPSPPSKLHSPPSLPNFLSYYHPHPPFSPSFIQNKPFSFTIFFFRDFPTNFTSQPKITKNLLLSSKKISIYKPANQIPTLISLSNHISAE